MATLEFRLTLSDGLAREAESMGLLRSEVIEHLLREEIHRRRVGDLFAAADRLAGQGITPMTAAEVEAEVQAARAERHARDARGH
jgi:hypothetical protein